MNIAEIDKNFKVETSFERDGLVFKNVLDEPFRVYGVFHDGEIFRRVPDDVAATVNPGVYNLAKHSAGGRVRFITDSPYVAIKAVITEPAKWSHMPLTASTGFDLYVKEGERFVPRKSFIPPHSFEGGYDSVYDFVGEPRERLVLIDFPLYNTVSDLYIGFKEGSLLKAAPDYKYESPIVYYGSSITQGGCASRPGMSYQAIIERRFDANYINLGFSGNGKGEDTMAEYIASLDMSAFVYDYDHNAPTIEHYKATHDRFYRKIRLYHPDIPVIMMTRPKAKNLLAESEFERIRIAKRTYNAAKRRGENVYFIPGYELMKYAEDEGTVDGCHPTDLGFYSMAKRLGSLLEKILK